MKLDLSAQTNAQVESALLEVAVMEEPAVMVEMEVVTNVKLAGGRKNPYQDRVTKVSKFNGLLTNNKESNTYSDLVKAQLLREGKDPESFTVGSRAWGERIENTALIEHKGCLYVSVLPLNYHSVDLYVDGLLYEGDKEELNIYTPPKKDDAQGGVSKSVKVSVYKLESIQNLKVV